MLERAGRELTLEEQSMPMAAIMPPAAIAASQALRHDSAKIFLGLVGADFEDRDFGERRERVAVDGMPIGIGDDRHMVTVAGSRSGKGRSVIVPTLLTYRGAMLVIDPKGELATMTARARVEKLGHRVVVLDPFKVTSGFAANLRARFNPMTILVTESPTLIEDAGLIADAIVIPAENQRDPHWEESARNLIEGLILHVATCPLYEGRRHLGAVRDLLAFRETAIAGKKGKAADRLRAEMEANDAASGMIIDASVDFFEKPDDERGSVLSTARRHARFLSYPAIHDCLAGHDIDLVDLKREAVTLYLCLPAMRLGTCARWLRLFVNLALAAFEAESAKPELPVVLCLDEFATLGKMRAIEDAAGQIAGFGVKLWPILQDLGQLKSLYAERWQTFLGNAGVIQCFANSDQFTLEYVSRRLGTTSLIVRNKGEVSDQDQTRTDRRGLSWQTTTQPLLTAEEIARLFGRDDAYLRQLVIWSGYDPIILSRAKYDTHALFAGDFDAVS
ncbi:MAG TPA: type IV secretory system conjugative DNA transfer family protein [Hyphomicrobiaceae bacterium]|nr:type IV secretory system conjugative DNA transfer family protein [Hyphomicrobiaceae bacterium]